MTWKLVFNPQQIAISGVAYTHLNLQLYCITSWTLANKAIVVIVDVKICINSHYKLHFESRIAFYFFNNQYNIQLLMYECRSNLMKYYGYHTVIIFVTKFVWITMYCRNFNKQPNFHRCIDMQYPNFSCPLIWRDYSVFLKIYKCLMLTYFPVVCVNSLQTL